ncbi:Protein of unknown function [Streptococcus thermophilus]|nr:Protein of unknown function [Streptococcus thermophilus]
MKHYPDETR